MNKDDMTMDQYMEMERSMTQAKTNIELAFELRISNDARNELYRQLYMCQKELRATKQELKFYKERHEQHLLGNLLVLPQKRQETGSTQAEQVELGGD